MKTILSIDAAILRICTKFSHALQRACGLTNYFVAKIGVFISSLGLIVDIANHFFFHRLLPKENQPLWFIFLLMWILVDMIRRSILLGKAEEYLWAGKNIKPRGFSIFLVGPVSRVVWIGLMCLNIFDPPPISSPHLLLEVIHRDFFSLGYVIFNYFAAVDPMPPGRSRLREWIEKFSAARKLVPATEN